MFTVEREARRAEIESKFRAFAKPDVVDKAAVQKLEEIREQALNMPPGDEQDAIWQKLGTTLNEIEQDRSQLIHENRHETDRRRGLFKLVKEYAHRDHLGHRKTEYVFHDGCVEEVIYETDADWMAHLQEQQNTAQEIADFRLRKARERLLQESLGFPEELTKLLDDPETLAKEIKENWHIDQRELALIQNAMTPGNAQKFADVLMGHTHSPVNEIVRASTNPIHIS